MIYNGEYDLNLIIFGIAAEVMLIGAYIASRQKSNKLTLFRSERRVSPDAEIKVEDGYFEKIRKKIKQAGISMPLYVYFGIAVVTGIIVYAITYFLIDSAGIAAVCALAGLLVPSRVVEFLREKRVREMEGHFTKALRQMASSFRAGGNIYRAVSDVEENEAMSDAIRDEMRSILKDYGFGYTFSDGFLHMYERTGIEDAKSVALAIDIGTRSGSNMAEAFENYIAAIHDRQAMIAEGKATLSGTKTQVTIMCFVPFVFSAFLKVSDPTYFDAAYNWLGGLGKYLIIMLYGIVVFGFFALHKMCDIKL